MSFFSKIGRTLKHVANPLNAPKDLKKDIKRVGGVKGLARIAVSATGVGALAVAAYDAKRYADKSRAAKTKFRRITRAALSEGDAAQSRIDQMLKPGAAGGHTHINPIQDKLLATPCGADAQSQMNCQYGFAPLQTGTGASLTPSLNTDKPAPEERGNVVGDTAKSKLAGPSVLIAVIIAGVALYGLRGGIARAN